MYGVACYLIWGGFPLFWPLLKPASPAEILAHRVFWTMVVVSGILTVQRRWGAVRRLRAQRRAIPLLALAAVLIGGNWLVYIWAVNSDQVVETSLGYFISPLVTILLGVLVLRERLRPAQWVATGVGALACLVLGVNYGRLPWIALTLASSFSCYVLIKKTINAGAVETVTVETMILTPIALAYLGWLASQGELVFGHSSIGNTVLLVIAGPVTAGPLMLFAAATVRLPLTGLGMLQYLTPSLQFVVGILVFHEAMPAVRLAGFALVWVALTILTVDGVRRQRGYVTRVAQPVAP